MLRSFNPTFAPIPNINITGGSITGITDLAVADGGTGASNAANARTNLGVGIGNGLESSGSDIVVKPNTSNGSLIDVTSSGVRVGYGDQNAGITPLYAWNNSSGASAAVSIGCAINKANVSASLYVADGVSQLGFGSAVLSFKIRNDRHIWSNQADTTEYARITATGNFGIGTATPKNKLEVNGSFGRTAPVTKTASFSLGSAENWVICNGSGSITVTLPTASDWTAREVTIKTITAQTVVSASSNVVPIDGSAAGTAILAATAGKFATLVSDGTNWIIMAAN